VHECSALFRAIRHPAAQALKKISFGDGEAISTLNLWEKLLKVKAWLGIKGIDLLPSMH
jgi:hypothetical protein